MAMNLDQVKARLRTKWKEQRSLSLDGHEEALASFIEDLRLDYKKMDYGIPGPRIELMAVEIAREHIVAPLARLQREFNQLLAHIWKDLQAFTMGVEETDGSYRGEFERAVELHRALHPDEWRKFKPLQVHVMINGFWRVISQGKRDDEDEADKELPEKEKTGSTFEQPFLPIKLPKKPSVNKELIEPTYKTKDATVPGGYRQADLAWARLKHEDGDFDIGRRQAILAMEKVARRQRINDEFHKRANDDREAFLRDLLDADEDDTPEEEASGAAE